MAHARHPTVRVRAVVIPHAARRSDPPPKANQSTQHMAAVTQEEADAYRILLESERRLKVEREFEALSDGWIDD
ncbi:MAG: hypothetical protein H6718_30455 [Polyangiaceae bacterium]|nr:hypothetical protein [Myxococcales bacterium]MCB9589776.1 hypothetical protein [Polyangiaceae bacterium]